MISIYEKAETSLAFLLVFLALFGPSCNHYALNKNERIVFFGDSITQLAVKPNGFITLIRQTFDQNDKTKNIEIIGAGISGNKVPDLLDRVQKDVLDKKPSIVIIYIGINDVWHSVMPGNHGTPKPEYEAGLKDLINQMKNANIRVILCTPTVIGEKADGSNPLDPMLEEYADISRRVAKSEKIQLCDLRKVFINYLKQNNPQNLEKRILTEDGVHLSDLGNRIMANAMLKMLMK